MFFCFNFIYLFIFNFKPPVWLNKTEYKVKFEVSFEIEKFGFFSNYHKENSQKVIKRDEFANTRAKVDSYPCSALFPSSTKALKKSSEKALYLTHTMFKLSSLRQLLRKAVILCHSVCFSKPLCTFLVRKVYNWLWGCLIK